MNQLDRLSAKIARLGEQIARETPAADPDRFVKFERDNHMPDGTVRPPRKREPTLAEMPEALRQYVGEGCTEAIRADEPKFKVGDRFIVGRQHREYFGDEVFVATKVVGDEVWFHRDGRDGFFFDFNIELLPSPKQEGE